MCRRCGLVDRSRLEERLRQTIRVVSEHWDVSGLDLFKWQNLQAPLERHGEGLEIIERFTNGSKHELAYAVAFMVSGGGTPQTIVNSQVAQTAIWSVLSEYRGNFIWLLPP